MLVDKMFVYHLDAELQKLYVNCNRYNANRVFNAFSVATRFAYLLCKDKLLIPISNYLESDMAFKILNSFEPLIQYDNCIKLLSTSHDLPSLLNKKKAEHTDNISNNEYHYLDFEDDKNEIYLPGIITQRKTSSSKFIQSTWLASIGSEAWSQLYYDTSSNMSISQFEKMLDAIPSRLEGRAYISDYITPILDISPEFSTKTNRFINIFVTQTYISSFLNEFNAYCLKDIPIIRSEEILPLANNDRYLSYTKYVQKSLSTKYKGGNAFDFLSNCTPFQLCEFKYSDIWKSICFPNEQSHVKVFAIGGLPKMNDNIYFGIVTALPEEYAAMKVLLENIKPANLPDYSKGNDSFEIGEIKADDGGSHRVVLALLPGMGNNFSAAISSNMLNRFSSIKNLILCGIAGGVPAKVHLGDVVVSTNGVFQYDLGKNNKHNFEERDPGSPCSAFFQSAIKYMKGNTIINKKDLLSLVNTINDNTDRKNDFSRPETITEKYEKLCFSLVYRIVERAVAKETTIYEGKIGSANVVQKDARKRDMLSKKNSIIAIEMEGAGLRDSTRLNNTGYIAVRGICDYCDKTKNDDWHNYAAAIAAAYTRALIESIPTLDSTVDMLKTVETETNKTV